MLEQYQDIMTTYEVTEALCIGKNRVYELLGNGSLKGPNFDILKILFAKRLILVEGSTEEMFINTMLDKEVGILNEYRSYRNRT